MLLHANARIHTDLTRSFHAHIQPHILADCALDLQIHPFDSAYRAFLGSYVDALKQDSNEKATQDPFVTFVEASHYYFGRFHPDRTFTAEIVEILAKLPPFNLTLFSFSLIYFQKV